MPVNDTSIAQINAVIAELKDKFTPNKTLMTAIQGHLQDSVDQNFINQGRDVPGGWPPLAASTVKQKQRRKQSPLMLTISGHLARSMQPGSTENEASVSTSVIYAAVHQFGHTFNISARSQVIHFKKKRSGQVRFAKEKKATFAQKVARAAYSVTIPARPFMVLTESYKNNIIEEIRKHVVK
jgi:phage gpG-like protein